MKVVDGKEIDIIDKGGYSVYICIIEFLEFFLSIFGFCV